MHNIDEKTYGLDPEAPKRGPAPPTRPNTKPGATGSIMLDVAVQQKRSSRAIQQASNDVVRNAYMTPIIMLAIGFFVAGTMIAVQDGLLYVLAYGISYAISVPIGVGVFLLFCLFWIGFDAPIHLIALQLAGIYAVTDGINSIVSLIPYGGFVLWLIPLLVYISLLCALLEIEIGEAVAVGITTFFVKVILAAIIYSAF